MSSTEPTRQPPQPAENERALAARMSQSANSLRTSQLQIEFGELGRQLVEVAKALPCVSGVRLWHIFGSESVVFYQTGELPLLDKPFPQEISQRCATNEQAISQSTYPLRVDTEIVGILELQSGEPPSDSAHRTVEKLVRLAEAGLNHVHKQHAVQELSAILDAAKLLNSTIDLSELINIILRISTRLCNTDRGTVFLVDHTRKEVWSLEGLGLEKREIRLPIDRGIVGWVACHGLPVIIEDAHSDPRFDPQADRDLGYHTRGLLAIPIRNKAGEIVGVLELLNKETGSFSAADANALSHLSDYVALALENARLHRESLAKQRMESDLALARGVQRGLLPERPPFLDMFEIGVAYTPSLMVGGDYYDFLRLKPDSLLAVIADVEGKSVASALMMANLQAALHTLVAYVHALEDVVTTVNNMILSDSRSHKLMSMFVTVIEPRERVLHYINAGHVPPVVLRRDGQTVLLSEGGMVLGAFPGPSFERGRIQLDTGDIVAAYTDGITEAMDTNGEQYGLERLVDLLRVERSAPASQIVETVLSEVDRFSEGGLHEDDRVILILKVR